uniref:Uncharacterized protein n=1 Tax=Lepeophtheirus salmonis TaxID=72036 RepID=A0A0K2TTZ6_LEPSM
MLTDNSIMFLNKTLVKENRIVFTLSSFKELSFLDDEVDKYWILDGRSISQNEFVHNIPQLLDILMNSCVSQLWISVNYYYFMEIRQRLIDRSKSNVKLKNDAIFKLFLEDKESNRDSASIIQNADEIRYMGGIFASVTNFQNICDGHPGLWNHVKKTSSLNVQSKWKNNSLVKRKLEDEPSAYDDRRRPKRKMIKELSKNLINSDSDLSSKLEDSSSKVKSCYMCKISKRTNDVRICEDCNKINLDMKIWKIDLSGRIAIVTGGRVKIGFETALRLLRNGCHVVATSRFPHDTLLRYQQLSDWEVIKDRLKIAKLDFLSINTIATFLKFFTDNYSHLDILINNAAQTIHRDANYYTPILEKEEYLRIHHTSEEDNNTLLMETCSSSKGTENAVEYFPIKSGPVIGDDPIDDSPRNSWTFNLDEVPLSEMLEVLTINTIGPFLLTSRLKPLLIKSPFPKRFIVNVSAMEGQFSRINKGHRHAHTNMAKAALNMMTRTAGLEFILDNVYMTSVDTGWVTDERPQHQAVYEKVIRGFDAPLSEEDGAARVVHPIFQGLSLKEEDDKKPYFAVFLKDFKAHPW